MKVVKVLNNSLVLATTSEGEEVILMGKGIGYNKAIGYELNKKDIQKVFVAKDRNVAVDIMELAEYTDAVYFDLAKSIIDFAVKKYDMKLIEHIYLSLTDHISYAVKRYHEGLILDNFYTHEIRRFNPDEFEVGEHAVNIINTSLSIDLPIDEAGNIAFHFINGQQTHKHVGNNNRIKKIITDILNIVKYHFTLIFDEKSLIYQRFVTHLTFLSHRILNHETNKNTDSVLFDYIVKDYPEAFACALKIERYILNEYALKLNKNELTYLTVHIQNVVKKMEEKNEIQGNGE